MTPFPELSIIIVNYNQKKDTIECIQSLINAGAGYNQIIVVDNASTDGSIEAIYERYRDNIQIIHSNINKGYPYALNLGIPKALENGAEWVLMINNDTIVDKDLINQLNIARQTHPEFSIISPIILYYNNPDLIWYLGYRILPGTLIGYGSYRGRKFTYNLPEYKSVDLFHGCAMMVNRDVFNKIGLFDESQLIYGDDADFSIRAKQAGFKGAVATRAKLWHKVSATMGQQNPKTRYLKIRNTVLFYRKYAHGLTKIIMQIFTLFRCLIIMLRDISMGNFKLIKPLWNGLLDGWRGQVPNRY
jgi:GT2 family glycosyltransferase